MLNENDRISCYVEGGDFAGHAYVGGGGPGFESGLCDNVCSNTTADSNYRYLQYPSIATKMSPINRD